MSQGRDPPRHARGTGSAHSFQELEDGLPSVLRGVVQVLQPQLQLPPRVLEHARVPQDLREQTAAVSRTWLCGAGWVAGPTGRGPQGAQGPETPLQSH